uniref:Helicase ATP-binding domain-containing protein n=1 Tax=Ciona savignyi TaxID=51511 RepID=H2YEC4_CIOSA
MFEMGFEYQVRSIANHVRPDRQTLLFSATFRKRIERLARDILTDPVRIIQGDVGEANNQTRSGKKGLVGIHDISNMQF